MRHFILHILIKDCSWLFIYAVIMRFNLTGETFLPETVRNFPEAAKTTFVEMIFASVFYNIVPIVVSLATYYFFYWSVKKVFGRTTTISLLITALLLTATTPICFIIPGNVRLFKLQATTLAWTLSFVISIITYFLFNKNIGHEIKIA
jgi:hypothetical protein